MEALRELARDPWWQVIAVLEDEDDDGVGGFAYTVGLAGEGRSELHIRARPSLGEDPGLDWRFSSHDMVHLLNDAAWRLVDGRLGVGSEWEESYDAGQVTVRFTVGAATDAEEVEAFRAGDATVHPVRWSLHREPEGPLAPMSEEQRAAAAEEYAAVVRLLPAGRAVLPGWELPASPHWSPEQRWGPRSPLVSARVQLMAHVSPGDMIEMLDLAFALSSRRMTGYAIVAARAAARPAGRSASIERLVDDASDLLAGLGLTWGHAAWEATVAWVNDDEPDPLDDAVIKGLLGEVITPYLVSVACEDLLPTDVLVHGAGPFVCAVSGCGLPPGPAWQAASHVVEATCSLVAAAGADGLVAAAAAWADADGDDYADARGRIMSLCVTTPSMFPDWRTALPPRLVAEVEHAAVDGVDGVDEADVQEWLSVVTTVLSHRAMLSSDTVELVLACGEETMPGLRRLLDEPLTTG